MTDFLIRKATATAFLLVAASAFGLDPFDLKVGEREIVATKAQRNALGLRAFMDGNLGVVTAGDKVLLYGANGPRSVRVTGTREQPFQKVEGVGIALGERRFRHLSGGPVYRDPQSKRLFLFYHAEVHSDKRGRKFYSTIGLAIQTDEAGLKFQDLGPIVTANLSIEKANGVVELCGSPYVIKDGYFYVYIRDALPGRYGTNNLSVARASVAEVVKSGIEGKGVDWKKYYSNSFSEPGNGGKSSRLEPGNPNTRWMDVSYNTSIKKYIMVVAANVRGGKVELFLSLSDDCIHWGERRRITYENGEAFYPSIVGFGEGQRETGSEFHVYYTFSVKGAWERWRDAVIVRRKITIKGDAQGGEDADDDK